MMILLLVSALAAWGVGATIRAIGTDGFRRQPTDTRRLP